MAAAARRDPRSRDRARSTIHAGWRSTRLTRRSVVAIACGLWLSACGEGGAPTAAHVQFPEQELNLGGLLSCPATPAASAVATIGPEGGTITVGPHTLRVPAGALSAPVTITAEAPSDAVVSVVLQPEGLEFQTPALLTLSYAHCGVLRAVLPKRIAYTTDALVILSYLPSWDFLLAQRVTGRLDHFSTYAVAW